MNGIIDDQALVNALIGCEELEDFDEYDLGDEEFLKALESVTELNVKVLKRGTFSEATLAQLNSILSHMTNLKSLMLENSGANRIDVSSVFDNLSSSIERVSIKNLDLQAMPDQASLERFSNLTDILYRGCNISELPEFPNPDRVTKLYSNTLIPNEQLIEFGMDHTLHTDIDEVIKVLRGIQKEHVIPLDLYEKYRHMFTDLNKDLCISIKSVGELDLEKLEELRQNSDVKEIFIANGCYPSDKEEARYSLDEYESIRTEVDKIVAQVKMPDDNDPNREKKIFAQIYKLLGEKISYDNYAISPEGLLDNQLQIDCRTLKNAMLGVSREGDDENKNLAVCAGIADALKNVSSVLGIECDFIGSSSQEMLELVNGAYVPKVNKDGKTVYRNGTTDPMGHAYNSVTLDGKTYYTDLTWDCSNIKSRRFPLQNFLNSAEDFAKSHTEVGFSARTTSRDATETISAHEQAKLFGEEISFNLQELNTMISEGYLSGFVSQYLAEVKQDRKGITSKELLEMMATIKSIEDHILARGDNRMNMGVKIGEEKRFIFETSDSRKLEEMQKQIRNRRERNGENYDER